MTPLLVRSVSSALAACISEDEDIGNDADDNDDDDNDEDDVGNDGNDDDGGDDDDDEEEKDDNDNDDDDVGEVGGVDRLRATPHEVREVRVGRGSRIRGCQ